MLWKVPVRDVWAAVQSAPWWTVPAIVSATLAVFVADTFASARTFSWFAAPLSFREALHIRGASYLLSVINYAAGQGAFVYFLHRKRRIPVLRSSATIVLVMGVNVLLLLTFASIGLLLARDIPPGLAETLRVTRLLTLVGWLGFSAYIAVLWLRPARLTRMKVLSVIFDAGLAGHLRALGVRIPHIGLLLCFAHLYLSAFGVDVPLRQALAFLPLALLVTALPLPAQGFGAPQLVMLAIFQSYAPGTGDEQSATVLAASLTGQAVAVATQLLLGALFMRSHLARDIQKAATES